MAETLTGGQRWLRMVGATAATFFFAVLANVVSTLLTRPAGEPPPGLYGAFARAVTGQVPAWLTLAVGPSAVLAGWLAAGRRLPAAHSVISRDMLETLEIKDRLHRGTKADYQERLEEVMAAAERKDAELRRAAGELEEVGEAFVLLQKFCIIAGDLHEMQVAGMMPGFDRWIDALEADFRRTEAGGTEEFLRHFIAGRDGLGPAPSRARQLLAYRCGELYDKANMLAAMSQVNATFPMGMLEEFRVAPGGKIESWYATWSAKQLESAPDVGLVPASRRAREEEARERLQGPARGDQPEDGARDQQQDTDAVDRA